MQGHGILHALLLGQMLSGQPSPARDGALDAFLERSLRSDSQVEAPAAEMAAGVAVERTASAMDLAALARALHLQERFAEAEKVHRRAIEAATRGPRLSNYNLARIHYNHAETLRLLERWADAEPIARKALELNRTAAADGEAVADSETQLAVVSLALGRTVEAEKLLTSALESRTRLLGQASAKVTNVKSWLARVRLQQRRFDEAIALLEQVHRERIAQSDVDEIIESASMLAAALEDANRELEAEPRRREALALAGQAEPLTAAWLRIDLGINLAKQSKDEAAEPLLRTGVAILSKDESTTELDLVGALDWLSTILARSSREEEALQLLRRVLAAEEVELGTRHPNVFETLSRQADVLLAQGKGAVAAQLLESARVRAAGSAPELMAKVERRLAAIYFAENALTKADLAADRALELLKDDPGGLDYAHAMVLKGAVASLQFRDDERVRYYRIALKVRRQHLGWKSSETYRLAFDLIDALKNLRQWPAAEEVAREAAYALTTSGETEAHAEALSKLAPTLGAQQRWSEASVILQQILLASAGKADLGSRINQANALVGLAEVEEARGDLQAAEVLLRQSLAKWQAINPEGFGRRNLAALQRHLSANLIRQLRFRESIPLLREARATFYTLEGDSSLNGAWATTALARSLAAVGDSKAAEPLFREALDKQERSASEIDLLEVLEGYASFYLGSRKNQLGALEHVRRAARIVRSEAANMASDNAHEQLRRRRSVFELQVRASWQLTRTDQHASSD